MANQEKGLSLKTSRINYQQLRFTMPLYLISPWHWGFPSMGDPQIDEQSMKNHHFGKPPCWNPTSILGKVAIHGRQIPHPAGVGVVLKFRCARRMVVFFFFLETWQRLGLDCGLDSLDYVILQSYVVVIIIYTNTKLIGGWATPLKIWKSVGMTVPNIWETQCPNHPSSSYYDNDNEYNDSNKKK